jgi:hypothetical protein
MDNHVWGGSRTHEPGLDSEVNLYHGTLGREKESLQATVEFVLGSATLADR